MRAFLEIARAGLVAILLHPSRSFVTTAVVIAMLLPYLVGLGISQGLQQQAEDSIHLGADLYVTGQRFGRNVPLALIELQPIQKLEGVTEVIPRIVGGIVLGRERENAVVVGIPPEKFPPSVTCVAGRLPKDEEVNELVVGTELAQRLNLEVGSVIPPFYHNTKGERFSKVVGIFKSDVSIWQARLIFTSLAAAEHIFDQKGSATDFLVYCRPGYEESVRSLILRKATVPVSEGQPTFHYQVVGRKDLEKLIPAGLRHREGIFNLHFLLVFALGIPLVMVSSGYGLSERRREVGILKAIGWQTDEILFRSLVESFFLSLASASLALILAYMWLAWLNGYWIAAIFLAGVDKIPSFQIPYRLAPIPALLSFLLSFVVVMSGTLYSSWRSATMAPMQAIR